MYKPSDEDMMKLAAEEPGAIPAESEVHSLVTKGESPEFYQGFISGLLLGQRAISRALLIEIDPLVLSAMATKAAQLYVQAKAEGVTGIQIQDWLEN